MINIFCLDCPGQDIASTLDMDPRYKLLGNIINRRSDFDDQARFISKEARIDGQFVIGVEFNLDLYHSMGGLSAKRIDFRIDEEKEVIALHFTGWCGSLI